MEITYVNHKEISLHEKASAAGGKVFLNHCRHDGMLLSYSYSYSSLNTHTYITHSHTHMYIKELHVYTITYTSNQVVHIHTASTYTQRAQTHREHIHTASKQRAHKGV